MNMRNDDLEFRVAFPYGKSPTDWALQHENGQVPDYWPYGLERVSHRGVNAGQLVLPKVGRFTKLAELSRILRPSPAKTTNLLLTWDEITARRAITHRPDANLFSGVIWATDQLLSSPRSIRALATKATLRKLDGMWCLSRPQAEVTAKMLGSDANMEFVPFGVDERFFEYHPYPSSPMVLSVGGDRDRDPKTLYAALEIVAQERPDVELVVQTASSLVPPTGVTRIPRLSHADLRNLYRRASVVTIATRQNWHASGMTVSLEAAATGRPVVACATPGMEDYVLEGETGHLVTPQNPEKLAHKTLEILADRSAGEALGRAGRSFVEIKRSTRIMAAAITEFINR